jgi:hypothetical protein
LVYREVLERVLVCHYVEMLENYTANERNSIEYLFSALEPQDPGFHTQLRLMARIKKVFRSFQFTLTFTFLLLSTPYFYHFFDYIEIEVVITVTTAVTSVSPVSFLPSCLGLVSGPVY